MEIKINPFKECDDFSRKKVSPETQPNSTLVFFLNLCFVLIYAPFRTQWSSKHSCYKIVQYNSQRFICTLLYLTVVHYHISTLINHFQNFAQMTGSAVSTIFRSASHLATTTSLLLLTKLILFLDKRKLEDFINATVSLSQNKYYFNFSKLAILIAFTTNAFSNYNTARNTFLSNDPNNYYKFYFGLIQYLSRTEIGGWIWVVLETHILLSFFIIQAFCFAVSCSLIGMTSDFKNSLGLYKNAEIKKVMKIF